MATSLRILYRGVLGYTCVRFVHHLGIAVIPVLLRGAKKRNQGNADQCRQPKREQAVSKDRPEVLATLHFFTSLGHI